MRKEGEVEGQAEDGIILGVRRCLSFWGFEFAVEDFGSCTARMP